jgi:hypothetical protein
MLDLLVLGRAVCVAPQWPRRRVAGAGRNNLERVLARAAIALVRRLLAEARG